MTDGILMREIASDFLLTNVTNFKDNYYYFSSILSLLLMKLMNEKLILIY